MSKAVESMRDRIKKRAETRKSAGGLSTLELPEGVDLYKPEKGTDEFDILPYRVSVDTHPEVKKGELWYERTYLAHRNVGPDEQFLVCPRTIGKRCPICEEHARLKKDPDADEDVVDGLRAKERELFNIILKGKDEVMVLDMSTFLFGRKLEEEIREGKEENAAFADLAGGKSLKIRWEQKSMGKQKFVEAGRIDFEDRDDIDEEALKVVVDLDKALKILSYEEIDKIFQAGSAEEDEDDKGKGKSDDDGEADADDDEERDEKPGRRVIGRGKLKDKSDDGDDKGATDGEDDEKPVKGKGKSKDADDDEDDEKPAKDEKKKKGKSEAEDCVACDGTGKNTKGKTCAICGGSGKDEDGTSSNKDDDDKDTPPDDDDEKDDKDEKDEKPTRRVIRR